MLAGALNILLALAARFLPDIIASFLPKPKPAVSDKDAALTTVRAADEAAKTANKGSITDDPNNLDR